VSITTLAQPKIWLLIYVSLPCAAPIALLALFWTRLSSWQL